MPHAPILLAHGSSNPHWRAPFPHGTEQARESARS